MGAPFAPAAYRYENGRVLWSDALARTNISTSVGALTTQAWTRQDLDATVIDPRATLYLRVLPCHEPARTAPAARQNVGA